MISWNLASRGHVLLQHVVVDFTVKLWRARGLKRRGQALHATVFRRLPTRHRHQYRLAYQVNGLDRTAPMRHLLLLDVKQTRDAEEKRRNFGHISDVLDQAAVGEGGVGFDFPPRFEGILLLLVDVQHIVLRVLAADALLLRHVFFLVPFTYFFQTTQRIMVVAEISLSSSIPNFFLH